MPGGENTKEKLPRCPKGEVRDKKTKKCVKKVKKVSPKNNTKKVSPKKVSPKKSSPNRRSSSTSSKRSPVVPLLSKIHPDINTKYYKGYIEHLLAKILNDIEYYNDRLNDGRHIQYYNLGDLEDFMNEEIDSIKKTHKSKYTDYSFSTNSAKLVLDHINQYIPYFNKVVDDDFRVEYPKIRKLYK